MKFEKPRVFERTNSLGVTYRVQFESDSQVSRSLNVNTGELTDVSWSLDEMFMSDDDYREVTPPTDITKLDTAGVFHAEPEKAKEPERTHGRVAYETWATTAGHTPSWKHLTYKEPWEVAAKAVVDFDNEATFAAQYKAFNATIAELREANSALEETLEVRDDERTKLLRMDAEKEREIDTLRARVAELKRQSAKVTRDSASWERIAKAAQAGIQQALRTSLEAMTAEAAK